MFRAELEDGSCIISDSEIPSWKVSHINNARRCIDREEAHHDALRSAPLTSVAPGINYVSSQDGDAYFNSWRRTRDARDSLSGMSKRYGVKVVSKEEADSLAQREREKEFDRWQREREREEKARRETKAKELTGKKLLELINQNYRSTYTIHRLFKCFVSRNHESSEIQNLRLVGQQFGDNPVNFDAIDSSLGLRTGCSAVFGQKHRLKLWRGEAKADNSATDQFISTVLRQYRL